MPSRPMPPVTNGRSSGSDRLAQQRLGHAGAEPVRDRDHLVGRVQAAGADQHGDFLALVQHLGGRLRARRISGTLLSAGKPDAGMRGAVRQRRILVGHQLQVVGQNDAGDGPLVLRDAHRAIHHVAHLTRHCADGDVLAGHILEQA